MRCIPLAEYGIIGDSRSAALVSRDGSIDWWCVPHFDSPSVFDRILDREVGGFFRVCPAGAFRVSRRYLPATNILATTFETPDGVVELLDLMPALTEAQKRQRLMPYRGILRRVRGVAGAVALDATFVPRFDYGRIVPRLELRGPGDVRTQVGHRLLHLRADLPLRLAGDRAGGHFTVRAGERRYLSLAYSEDAPSVYPRLGVAADEIIALSHDFWRDWSAQCRYAGPYAEAVLRSALVLKLLAYAPSGAIVAAPTTSLPEDLGGVRNWDYRYCWLRDASMMVRVLGNLGFRAESHAFGQWLLHATALTHPAFQVVYTPFGDARIPERILRFLSGYCDSRPVRVGNAADTQLQLDVYGEVFGALARLYRETGAIDPDTRHLLVGAADLVARIWGEPDDGIWEPRSARRQHVYSKVMCWAALDRAAWIARAAGIRADVARWERTREEIRAVVLRDGFNPTLGSFVSVLGGDQVDASLLRIPFVGFLPGDDPRMLSTIAVIRRTLGRDGLLYRYRGIDDGLPGREGAFLACSFWLVASLALAGRLDEAHRLFQELLDRASDLGLYAEEMDPGTNRLLGNFPQGLTHLALVNAALTLRGVEGHGAPSAAGRTSRGLPRRRGGPGGSPGGSGSRS